MTNPLYRVYDQSTGKNVEPKQKVYVSPAGYVVDPESESEYTSHLLVDPFICRDVDGRPIFRHDVITYLVGVKSYTGVVFFVGGQVSVVPNFSGLPDIALIKSSQYFGIEYAMNTLCNLPKHIAFKEDRCLSNAR